MADPTPTPLPELEVPSADPTGLPPAPSGGLLGALRIAWGGWPGRVFRVLLAVLPLVWLSRRMQWSAVAQNALTIGPLWLGASLGAMYLSFLACALRWRGLLLCYGADPAQLPPFRTLMRYFMVGHYFAVLPSGVVGEAVRGSRVAHLFPDPVTSYVVLFIDRLGGLLGLLMLAGTAILASPASQHDAVTAAINLGLAAAVPLTVVALALPQLRERVPGLYKLFTRVPVVGPLFARIPVAQRPIYFVPFVLLSLVAQSCAVFFVAALLQPLVALDGGSLLLSCLRTVPAIVLVTYIPLTPGGVGQREIAFATLFGRTAVPAAAAVTASLMVFSLSMFLALLGGLVLLYERRFLAPKER